MVTGLRVLLGAGVGARRLELQVRWGVLAARQGGGQVPGRPGRILMSLQRLG